MIRTPERPEQEQHSLVKCVACASIGSLCLLIGRQTPFENYACKQKIGSNEINSPAPSGSWVTDAIEPCYPNTDA